VATGRLSLGVFDNAKLFWRIWWRGLASIRIQLTGATVLHEAMQSATSRATVLHEPCSATFRATVLHEPCSATFRATVLHEPCSATFRATVLHEACSATFRWLV